MSKEIGLYVHWPFCLSKCPYCDFNSHVSENIDFDRWERTLLKEIDYFGLRTPDCTLKSVFFGGGTPSLMQPRLINKILSRLNLFWKVENNIEVSLEANPSSVEADKFRSFKTSGVNRLSLGIQSLNNASLEFLGRKHTAEEAIKALEVANQYFTNCSFDLIYGLPNQSAQSWKHELKDALSIAGQHISLYQLTIEPGTIFSKKKIPTHSSDALADFYEETQEIMNENNLPAYEISNHASTGHQCRHNVNYWSGYDYIGAGPGAHGRITNNNATTSMYQVHNPQTWLNLVETNGNGIAKERVLSKKKRAEEVVIMGLRTTEGINFRLFKENTALSFHHVVSERALSKLLKNKFLQQTQTNIYATLSGRMCLNTVLYHLLN